MMKIKMLAALSIFTILVQTSASDLSKIYVKDGQFVDLDGRIRLFRGINSVIKHYPWYDPKMLDSERHRQLGDWGFNAIRLGAMWSGVEPEQGHINETYIDILKEIVDGLRSNGIYTYLDMHQDVLTEVASYNGIPRWLSSQFRTPDHAYPWPMKDTSGYSTWACGYFTQEIANSFQQLYTEHKEEFSNVWRQIAVRFKGMSEILGYELLNEPWTGDFFEDLSILLPGNAGRELLEPFYNSAHEAVREVDTETLIFWEPVTYAYIVNSEPNIILDTLIDNFFKSQNYSIVLPIIKQVCGDLEEGAIEEMMRMKEVKSAIDRIKIKYSNINNPGSSQRPSVLGPGFSAPPGGEAYLNRTVMSYHYYCWALGYSSDQEFDPALRFVCDDVLGPMVFNTAGARAEELGGSARMLTEFGECNPDISHPDYQGTIQCEAVLAEADRHLQSWSYWDTAYGGIFWDEEGEVNWNTVKVFTRPYPPATAGIPVSLNFDPETRQMEYLYLPNLQIIAPTELYVPSLIYPEGANVHTSDHAAWNHDAHDTNKILVTAFAEDLVTVTISPK